jgi:hypothetical protein
MSIRHCEKLKSLLVTYTKIHNLSKITSNILKFLSENLLTSTKMVFTIPSEFGYVILTGVGSAFVLMYKVNQEKNHVIYQFAS